MSSYPSQPEQTLQQKARVDLLEQQQKEASVRVRQLLDQARLVSAEEILAAVYSSEQRSIQRKTL